MLSEVPLRCRRSCATTPRHPPHKGTAGQLLFSPEGKGPGVVGNVIFVGCVRVTSLMQPLGPTLHYQYAPPLHGHRTIKS